MFEKASNLSDPILSDYARRTPCERHQNRLCLSLSGQAVHRSRVWYFPNWSQNPISFYPDRTASVCTFLSWVPE